MAKLIDNNPVAHTILAWAGRLPDIELMCVCRYPEGGVIGVFAQPVLDEMAVTLCNARLPGIDEHDMFSSGYLFSTIRASQIVKNDEWDFDGADWNKAYRHLCSEYDAYLCLWSGGLPDFVTQAFMQGMDEYRRKLITEFAA